MREIFLTVNGDSAVVSQRRAGVQGEGNITALYVTFDSTWNGLTKQITYFDAMGENPVKRMLTVDLLMEDGSYRTFIPPEPLAEAGECLLVLDGYIEGKRARTMAIRMKVSGAPPATWAGEPADPIPSLAEQLQAEIEFLWQYINGNKDGYYVPAGGAAGEALVKRSDADRDVTWEDITITDIYVDDDGWLIVVVGDGGFHEREVVIGDVSMELDNRHLFESLALETTESGASTQQVTAPVLEALYAHVSLGSAAIALAVGDEDSPAITDIEMEVNT